MQARNTMPAMRAYSRSFSYNLRGLRATATHTTWLARSIIDLQHWRNALRNATCDLSWLRIPTNWPPLLAKQRNETHTARSQRQAAAADIVGFADACTNGNGIGIYFPDRFWSSLALPDLTSISDADGKTLPTNINVLEFIAVISAIHTLLTHITSHNTHVHIWTDSTTCLYWIMKHRTDRPICAYLIQTLTDLAMKTNALITVGHLPGAENTVADAISRAFQCHGGTKINRDLKALPYRPVCMRFASCIKTAAMSPYKDIWKTAPERHTAQDIGTSNASAQPMASPSRKTISLPSSCSSTSLHTYEQPMNSRRQRSINTSHTRARTSSKPDSSTQSATSGPSGANGCCIVTQKKTALTFPFDSRSAQDPAHLPTRRQRHQDRRTTARTHDTTRHGHLRRHCDRLRLFPPPW